MSGIGHRIAELLRTKANKALDRAEDPRETLDYSYERQLDLLQKVRRGLADVAASRKQVELQLTQLRESDEKFQTQARQALEAGREDMAREALEQRATVTAKISELEGQRSSLQADEARLTEASQDLQAKVEAFRTGKETIKAGYTAAEAETRIREATTGVGDEMADIGEATQRAQDRTEELQARAQALDELIASGAVPDALPQPADTEDPAATREQEVEKELTRMKAQLQAPRAEEGPRPDA